MSTDLKSNIQIALQAFAAQPLRSAAIDLFTQLGYQSERVLPIDSVAALKEQLDDRNYLNSETALLNKWRNVHWLFQLTPQEIGTQSQGVLQLSNPKQFDAKEIFSYLFFAIELTLTPNKSELVKITRALNRIVSMPILVLFKHEQKLSLAIVNRRRNLRDDSKQVLTAVSLIRDISITQPHRAHIGLLEKFSLPNLHSATERGLRIETFADLDNAWQKILSIEALNKRFYDDLAAWFNWARGEIKLAKYPIGTPPEDTKEYLAARDKARDEFLVRLVCRLMFTWFLKEKSLIPNHLIELFNLKDERQVLCGSEFDADFFEGNHYYRGVLQNIFFKSLNTPHTERQGKTPRFLGQRYLQAKFNYAQFDVIPYLNGGLFEQQEEDNYCDSIEDGALKIPNKLFYASIDDGFSVSVGTGRGSTRPVQGINRIFSNYVFTVTENTSLDEDVALDPELLGLVFENLLAEIDPNIEHTVRTSIRKQSGSYYTPKRVVQYMVNDSLYLYLKTALDDDQQQTQNLLTDLCFQSYDAHAEAAQTARYQPIANRVVDALDALRTLDPACGSGAFPMGMLHRMVELLRVVDPHNQHWKTKLINQFPPETRDAITRDLEGKTYDYQRKLGIVRRSLYGVDIQPLAALIAKLRFFLSLIIEQTPTQKIADNYGLTPLPNLETNLLCANTLNDISIDLFSGAGLDDYLRSREEYFQPNLSRSAREGIANAIGVQLHNLFPRFSQDALGIKPPSDPETAKTQNAKQLVRWFRTAAIPAPFFSATAFFPEVMRNNAATGTPNNAGFHIVIGNPPYGGTKVDDKVKDALGLGSKDPYGAFMARFINNRSPNCPVSPLAANGVLAMIVSDTFMTIKSHKPLRQHLLANRVHKVLRVHPDTFNATVNTAIVVCQLGPAPADHRIQVADFTNVSIHTDYPRFTHLLRQTEGTGFAHRLQISNAQYAIYHYPQSLIATNSNHPLFAASPKLFALMNDVVGARPQDVAGKQVPVRTITMNGKPMQLVKLGDIAEVKVGLQTGDNHSYLYQEPDARGNYRSIEDLRHCVLTAADLARIQSDETSRADVVQHGIAVTDKTSSRYFDGRYIAPYDKGGESDADEGWMPNYHVPTQYFIDWSEESLNRLLTFTGKSEGGKLASRFQNVDYYYERGISFSDTGVYAPTFRYLSGGIFDVMGMSVFTDADLEPFLGTLTSKLTRFTVKNFVNATVHTQVDGLKCVPFSLSVFENSLISKSVKKIVEKQSNDTQTSKYDYASNEQLDIDAAVYAAYGLNADDVREVEHWYARRYPTLARAQRDNLRATGKALPITNTVLHWYGDESRHLSQDHSPVMLMGGLTCPAEHVHKAHVQLAALWAAHDLPKGFEAKWTKVSPGKLSFYLALVDWFFSFEHVAVRALVLPNKQTFFAKLPSAAQDAAYYRLYYYLLHGALEQDVQLKVFMDIKDTRGGLKVRHLREMLQDDAGDAQMVKHVQQVRSDEVRLLQVLDLMLGAMGYARLPEQNSAAKKAVIARIEHHLQGQSLALDTPYGSSKISIQSWYDLDALVV